MLKTRKKAESNTMQNLPLVWDDKPNEGRRAMVNLQSVMSSKPEHEETAEDAANALIGREETDNAASSRQTTRFGGSLPPTPQMTAPQPPSPPPQEAPKEPEEEPEEEPEIFEISDDESLGDALTKLRGSLGCSLQDLANKTKIPIQKIRALEEGNYEQISNINVGADYVRKLCIEYVVAPDKYVQKFRDAYRAYGNDDEPSVRTVSATSTGGLREIEIPKKHFVSIPSLLIGTLIVVLCLFVLGGLAKLYFRKTAVKSPASLSELVPVNRGALTVLPIPEEQ
ncbi:MAG: helix-turn-helix domain-containing protein [Victivallales bacterium]|nr:helix-turn-helix domain-containing protein [Victivallales bacterium]